MAKTTVSNFFNSVSEYLTKTWDEQFELGERFVSEKMKKFSLEFSNIGNFFADPGEYNEEPRLSERGWEFRPVSETNENEDLTGRIIVYNDWNGTIYFSANNDGYIEYCGIHLQIVGDEIEITSGECGWDTSDEEMIDLAVRFYAIFSIA